MASNRPAVTLRFRELKVDRTSYCHPASFLVTFIEFGRDSAGDIRALASDLIGLICDVNGPRKALLEKGWLAYLGY